MTRAATRRRILDAAERLFAEHGYAGASIRRITTEADSDLGAVRYHFGSKDRLFGEVMRRRLEPLCRERIKGLDLIESKAGKRTLALENIVSAYVAPLRQLMSDKTRSRTCMKLIARVRVEPGQYLDCVQNMYGELFERYRAALRRALPKLTEDELTYRLYFMFGTVVNTLIDDGTLRALGKGLPDSVADPDSVIDALVRFVAAGMSSPSGSGKRHTGAATEAAARTTGA